MKSVNIILTLAISNLVTSAQITGKLTDVRDGHVYKTIQIGNQTWMAENLNFATDTGSICYDNQPSNCEKFGRLYTWDVAKIVCPMGWHLPSDNEWQILEKTIGMPENEINLIGYRGGNNNIAGKIKSKKNWDSSSDLVYEDIGFNALPAGNYGFHENLFGLLNCNAFFWTSTAYKNEFAWNRDIRYTDNTIYRSQKFRLVGFSVRCIKD
jgi:uncharacterized protein (TIGR02145 family)